MVVIYWLQEKSINDNKSQWNYWLVLVFTRWPLVILIVIVGNHWSSSFIDDFHKAFDWQLNLLVNVIANGKVQCSVSIEWILSCCCWRYKSTTWERGGVGGDDDDDKMSEIFFPLPDNFSDNSINHSMFFSDLWSILIIFNSIHDHFSLHVNLLFFVYCFLLKQLSCISTD